MIVRELLTRFGFNIDQTSVSKAEASVNRLSGMLSGLAAFASLKALAGVADSMQSLEARIGMLPQTVGDAGDAFNTVADHASAARQPLEAYATLYTRIGNAAKGVVKDQGTLLTVTDTISKALVVGGANAQEQASAMLQFSQALGSGVLQGDEFRAMAEAAPQYLDALSEALGYPREQLKKMASEGKITTKQIIEATLKMSNMFDAKFKQMPMTIGAATTIMSNRWKQFIAGLNRESLVVTKVADLMLTAFDGIERGLKKMVSFFGGATNTLKLFGIVVGALLGPMAIGGLISLFGVLFSTAGMLFVGLVILGVVIEDLYQYFTGGESVLGDFIEWLNGGSIAANMMGFAIMALTTAMVMWGSLSAAAWIRAGTAAVVNGVKMAAAWVMAMGPLGLVIAAIVAIVAGIAWLSQNWQEVFSVIGEWINKTIALLWKLLDFIPGANLIKKGLELTGIVSPDKAAGAATGGATNVNNNQTINLTVPPGTPEQQQAAIQESAKQAFSADNRAALDMAVYAP